LEEEYERTKQIIDDYDYNAGYVVIVYSLDNKWKKDFDLIKKSKYSETSKEFKNLFPEKITHFEKKTNQTQTSLQHLVFRKDKKLLAFWEEKLGTDMLTKNNLEIWSEFDVKKETLDIKKHYENKTNIK